jgi:hypothetical protein
VTTVDLGVPLRQEELGRAYLEKWIRQQIPGSNPQRQYVPRNEQQEQPDFYLSLGNLKFAVEVSGLMRQVQVGGKLLDEETITSTLWRFVKEIEQVSLKEGFLEGAYVVDFLRPIENFGTVRRKLREEILHLIRSTRTAQSFPCRILTDGRCWVSKGHLQRNAVYPVGPGDSGSEGEVTAVASGLLGQAIKSQLDKKWVVNTALPIIIVLIDYYHLAELYMYQQHVADLSMGDRLHSLFLIKGDMPVLLWAKAGSWKRRSQHLDSIG